MSTLLFIKHHLLAIVNHLEGNAILWKEPIAGPRPLNNQTGVLNIKVPYMKSISINVSKKKTHYFTIPYLLLDFFTQMQVVAIGVQSIY